MPDPLNQNSIKQHENAKLELIEGEGESSYQDAFRSGKGSHQLVLTLYLF